MRARRGSPTPKLISCGSRRLCLADRPLLRRDFEKTARTQSIPRLIGKTKKRVCYTIGILVRLIFLEQMGKIKGTVLTLRKRLFGRRYLQCMNSFTVLSKAILPAIPGLPAVPTPPTERYSAMRYSVSGWRISAHSFQCRPAFARSDAAQASIMSMRARLFGSDFKRSAADWMLSAQSCLCFVALVERAWILLASSNNSHAALTP